MSLRIVVMFRKKLLVLLPPLRFYTSILELVGKPHSLELSVVDCDYYEKSISARFGQK